MLRSSKAFRLLMLLAAGLILGSVLGIAAVYLQNQMNTSDLELTASAVVRSNRRIETQLAPTLLGTSIAITQTLAALTPTAQP